MGQGFRFKIRLTLLIGATFFLQDMWAQEPAELSLRPEEIKNRMTAVERSTSLSDSLKTFIRDQYNQALADIELTAGYRETIERLKKELEEAPKRIRRINAELERKRSSDSGPNQNLPEISNPDELDRLFGTILASRREAEAELERLNKQLEEEYGKPPRVREKIISIRTLMDDLKAESQTQLEDVGTPLAREAIEVAAAAKDAALKAEIERLDQELLGNRARIQLLRAQKEDAVFSLGQIDDQLRTVREALEQARMEVFERVRLENEAILEQDTVVPVLSYVAGKNLELIEQYKSQLFLYDSIQVQEDYFKPMIENLSRVVQNTQLRLDLKQANVPLGNIIREERQEFPKPEFFANLRRRVNEALSLIGLRLINAEALRNELLDREAFLQARMSEAKMDSIGPEEKQRFLELAEQYETLLDQNITNDVSLERNLRELDKVFQELQKKTEEYDQFLEERLLWVRSAAPVHWSDFKKIPSVIQYYSDPQNWALVLQAGWRGIQNFPWKLTYIFLALVLLFSRGIIHKGLVASGKHVGKINNDHVFYSLEAIFLTLLLVLPFPLVFGFVSDILYSGSYGNTFVLGFALAMYRLGLSGFFFLVILGLFMKDGVADKHFRWEKRRRTETFQVIRRFTLIALPFLFLTAFSMNARPADYGGVVGLFFFTGYALSILYLAYAFFHPNKGLMRYFYANRKDSFWWRRRWLWFLVATLAPVLLTLLAWYGFIHTTADLYYSLKYTVWLLAGIWLLSSLASRSMLILRRKLMYEAVKKKQESERQAALESRNDIEPTTVPIESDTSEIDKVTAMDNDTRQLFNAAMVLLAVVGLAWIWEDVFPALRVLDGISIWSQTSLVEGVETVYSISLVDLLKALVFGFLAFILAKNLPSLINILLVKQGGSGSGTRYAVATLLQYAIIAIGTLIVFSSLGVTGEQLGWAAAALGVGIGFGLQEIVANFISGIIVLFEQPVRVGDVVTIGNATGVVSRIHIRATTIRDWENKELLVPNRELITGQVLNWTLSDTITRVEIVVGIAFGSDVQKALDILIQTAQENPRILDQPAPFVHFEQFGENSLKLTLRAFVPAMGERLSAVTEMNKVIDRRFLEEGIVIAYPQMDIHLKRENGTGRPGVLKPSPEDIGHSE
jgi:potassium efflux system protein